MKLKQLINIKVLLIVSGLQLNAQLPAYLPANGLVAWYPFNGNANDESGNGNNGAVNGALLTIDRFSNSNSAYDFDGINNEILIQHNDILNTLPITASCWFKSNTPQQNKMLINKYVCQSYNGYSFQLTVNRPSAFYFSNLSSHYFDNPLDENNLDFNDDIWHHALWIINENEIKIYCDGVIIYYSNSSGPLASTTTNATLRFGSYAQGICAGSPQNFFYKGQIDDVAIYNRALTQAEITSLYTATGTNTGGGTTSTTTAPPGIPYQAEVRNDNGEVLANADVNLRFTLHELTANGAVSYQETHTLTTNELGLFAATIGAGNATQGTFAGINWSQTTKFLQVEVDAGNGYITMGNQQLMSVPYALYAANSQPGPQGPAGEPGPQGQAGLDGAAGSDGFNSLVRTSQISNTNECGTNGILIEAGIDFNRNDFLDNSEVQPNSAQVICSTNSNQSSIISFSGTYPTLNSPILGQMAISSTSGATFIFNGLVWNQILTSCTQPTAANAGSNQQVLNYQQVQLNANSPAIGSGRWKIINGSGGSFDNPINPAAKFVGLPNTNYTLGWVTTSLCDSSISTINIQYISSTTITQSGIWTVPEGIDSIKIELIGAGGGGAPGATCGYYGCYVKTGGGGAGGYGVIYLPVEANQQLSFTVGTGGSASANGTSSIFENYYAGGGNSGAIGGSGGISNCPVSSQGSNGGLPASGCCCPSNYFNGAAGVNNRGGGGDGGFYANCGSSIAFSQTGQNGGIIITPLN